MLVAGSAAVAVAKEYGEPAMIIRPVILLTIGATLLFLVVRRMRHQRLKERHALMFIFTAIPFMVLAIWPDGVRMLAVALGIANSTAMLLGVSVFLVLLIFELLTIVSVLDRRVSTLAQMVGILNEKLQLIERRQADQPPKGTGPPSPKPAKPIEAPSPGIDTWIEPVVYPQAHPATVQEPPQSPIPVGYEIAASETSETPKPR